MSNVHVHVHINTALESLGMYNGIAVLGRCLIDVGFM